MKTPNYVLTAAHTYHFGPHDTKVFDAGTFVRPIEKRWLPKHVLEHKDNRWVDHSREVFCYTRWGILLLPRNILRQV